MVVNGRANTPSPLPVCVSTNMQSLCTRMYTSLQSLCTYMYTSCPLLNAQACAWTAAGLLLSYLGTASDVVDFFSVLAEEEQLRRDLPFVFTILAVWSWSLVQFMFVVTMTKAKVAGDGGQESESRAMNNRVSPDESGSRPERGDDDVAHVVVDDVDVDDMKPAKTGCARTRSLCHGFVESELWSIFVSVVLQDGPYVMVRLACVFYWKIRTYTNYFFTAKNCMMLVLQVYRIVTLYEKHQQQQKTRLGKTL